MAGKKPKIVNYSNLATAKEMENNGADSETIRQNTGWFKGYDGKWRFEIDDSEIEIATNGRFSRNPDISRYAELIDKVYFKNDFTSEEESELRELDKKLEGKSVEPEYLGDLIKHDKLFEAYPQLKEISVYFAKNTKGELAAYHPGLKEIALDHKLKIRPDELKSTLIHEIQHAIQDIEGFAEGSSIEYWDNADVSKMHDKSSYDLYKSTSGEVEARDASKRMNLTAEERKNTRPDIDRTDVMFAEESGISFKSMSEYPEETQVVISEYLNSVNTDVLELVKKVKDGNKNFIRVPISNVTDKQVTDIKKLLGIDVTGYKNCINTSSIEHILNRHGENGKHDHSMSNDKDIARIEYIINNYDNVELLRDNNGEIVLSKSFIDKNNKPAPLIIYSKNIDGTHYVVKAIPENKYKKLWVVTAYIKNKNTVTQALDEKFPRTTSETALASPVFSNTILFQKTSKVNTENVEDVSDVKCSIDDSFNDWLDDAVPQGIDFDKVLEINPTVALATVYRSATKTTESGLAQSKGVDIDDKAFLSIARKVMQRYELFTNIFDIY